MSDSVFEDLKIDAFADDDEPTLIVSTRLEEEASDLQPGQSLTCRVSCACRAPFVVPPELAVRFEWKEKVRLRSAAAGGGDLFLPSRMDIMR